MTRDAFEDTGNPNLLGLWDFAPGAASKDSATAVDGRAQNGTLEGDGSVFNEAVRFDDGQDDDYFFVRGDAGGPDESVFDLSKGTVQVRFTQSVHNNGVNPDVLVSRGEADDQFAEGVFQLRVTDDGRVEAAHTAPAGGSGTTVLLTTNRGFFNLGDDVEAYYAFDAATGASLQVINHTTGVTQTISDASPGLTFDIGDNDDQIFTFGAAEAADEVFENEFSGSIGYVAVYNEDLVTNPPAPVVTTGLDGIVEGTAGADIIDAAYTGDPEGDRIDNGDAVFGSNPNADIVLAGAGDDIVVAGQDGDLVFGGAGDDIITGDASDDILIGDGPSGRAGLQTLRESFEWDRLGAPDGEAVSAFSQTTGFVTVDFRVTSADLGTTTTFADDTQRTIGIDGGEETVTPTSSLESATTGTGQTVTYELDFSLNVDNASFRINGVDGGARVKVTAFDELGNAVDVDLTGGRDVTLTDTDAQFDEDTAQADGPLTADDAEASSVLVAIPSNVARIVIEHDQFNAQSADINITDVYYDVTTDVGFAAAPNLIVNGSFEDTAGMEARAYGWKGDEVNGWQTSPTGALVDVHNNERGGLVATDGDNWLDLSERGDQTLVFQDIDVDPNSKYLLRFDAGDEPLRENGLEVYWNGELVRTLTAAEVPDGSFASFQLVLDGDSGDGSGRLAFGGLGPSDNVGAAIDSVEMYAFDPSEGTGNDRLIGGLGEDVLFGGGGDDRINLNGDTEADEAYGGDDQDTFTFIGVNDYIEGGEGGVDNDTLDLTPLSNITVDFDPTDSEAGTVTFFDGSGGVTGTATFSEIENVIICFTPGSTVETEFGLRPVEAIRQGDRVWTRDNGLQEVRWASRSDLSAADLAARPHLAPVLIRKGALGYNVPERDMVVSPNHRMLIESTDAALYFAEPEVLAAAKHLVDGASVLRARVPQVSYIHFMFDQHEVVRVDGAWSESFQPGDYSLNGLDAAQRGEILELFPELGSDQGLQDYAAARLSLKKHEARLLLR